MCPRTRVPQTSRVYKALGSPGSRARSSQTPGVWYVRPGTPRLPRTRAPQTRTPQNPGHTSLPGPGRPLPHPPPHPPPGISPARPHPGRPVRVALHLGKHQVPGLEGVRHAGGGKPRPREAAAAAAAAAVEAAAGRRSRGREQGTKGAETVAWTAAGACLLGCALTPDVPPSCRHRRETRSLRTTCRDRGAQRPMTRGVWRAL